MIFEAATDDANAVGQQGGRNRVAGKALIGRAVEREAERLRAIDRAAVGEAPGHTIGSDPVTTWVTVSRDSTIQRPQPAL